MVNYYAFIRDIGPRVLRCISDRMSMAHFSGHSDEPLHPAKGPLTNKARIDYYRKLGTVMYGLGMPGLGYDCYRNWELLTMGSMVVIERGIGLDRTVSEAAVFHLVWLCVTSRLFFSSVLCVITNFCFVCM